MSAKLKIHVGNKILHKIKTKLSHVNPEHIKPLIEVANVQSYEKNFAKLYLPLDKLQKFLGISNTNDILDIGTDEMISKVCLDEDRANRKICFSIRNDIFIKDVLENINKPDLLPVKKKIIVEFSSPNIAKPFHVGHLRSTIIGNFVSNIHKFLGNDVVKINYLGDWGTQFGLLKVGVDLKNYSDEHIRKDPLNSLYEAYIHANKLAETDPEIGKQARKAFSELESGTLSDLERWKTFSQYSVDQLTSVYERLGIKFDEYQFESMYNAKELQKLIEQFEKFKILQKDLEGRQVIVIQDRKIPLIKSDGSMLYLTRDIAAAIERFDKNKFDEMLYIVDNSQSEHFNNLQKILYRMDLPWAGRIRHIKFGRIRGMSTRKGTAIFLQDILDEIHELMRENQEKSPTTKVSLDDKRTTDILGISSVIVHDLKQRRQKDYQFEWDKVLEVKGDTGVRLQYTYARLCSLEEVTGIRPAELCDPKFLQDPDIILLVIQLARFNDTLIRSYQETEACLLVRYLFHLCNYIGKALKTLKVKDQSTDVARQRMLLFSVSKDVLKQGMEILGLQPLRKM